MKLADVQTLAYEYLMLYELDTLGWKFKFNKNKRRLGVCRYIQKSIELSAYYAHSAELADIRDTILHEIAHALVGPGYGHGPVWKRKAIEVGATPKACGTHINTIGARYTADCSCGIVHVRFRKPKPTIKFYCKRIGESAGYLQFKKIGE